LTAEDVSRRHAHRIYNLARRLLSNEADVEAVTQEALLQVVRRLGSFRGQAELTTWLHRATVQAALRHRRQAQLSAAAPAGPRESPALAS
jgi:RNA polymerase sigma-70 factor (ECF subfamily)